MYKWYVCGMWCVCALMVSIPIIHMVTHNEHLGIEDENNGKLHASMNKKLGNRPEQNPSRLNC